MSTNAKISQLIDLKARYDEARTKAEAAARIEDQTRLAYHDELREMIDLSKVQTNQVYLVNGRSVIFRKVYDSDHHRNRGGTEYEYLLEILPLPVTPR